MCKLINTEGVKACRQVQGKSTLAYTVPILFCIFSKGQTHVRTHYLHNLTNNTCTKRKHTYVRTCMHTHPYTHLVAQRCTGMFQVDQNLLILVEFLNNNMQHSNKQCDSHTILGWNCTHHSHTNTYKSLPCIVQGNMYHRTHAHMHTRTHACMHTRTHVHTRTLDLPKVLVELPGLQTSAALPPHSVQSGRTSRRRATTADGWAPTAHTHTHSTHTHTHAHTYKLEEKESCKKHCPQG